MIGKLKIAVLRGGPGYDYDISMQTGLYVLKNLSSEKYIVYDVTISRNGDWFLAGFLTTPEKILMKTDVVFNAVKGKYAKGELQRLLNDFSVPFTGSTALASALSTNKHLARKILNKEGIKTPYYSLIRKEDYDRSRIHKIFREIPAPFVVKPVSEDSSFGVGVAFNVQDLIKLTEENLESFDAVLIEEYIKGKEVVCGVIDDFRDKTHYTFLPIEVKKKKEYLSNSCKLENDFELIIPAEINSNKMREIESLSMKAHQLLNLDDYSHSDFIISAKGNIYLLEVNIFPDIREGSVLEKMLEASGSGLLELIEHLINKARKY